MWKTDWLNLEDLDSIAAVVSRLLAEGRFGSPASNATPSTAETPQNAGQGNKRRLDDGVENADRLQNTEQRSNNAGTKLVAFVCMVSRPG